MEELKQYYGKNYDKAMKNWKLGVEKAKLDFKQKHPNANINNFDFDVTVGKSGEIEDTNIYYKINEDEGYDINSETFRTKYSDSLYWHPRMWGTSGTVQPFKSVGSELPYDVTKFRIYVNDSDSFLSNFETLNTSWKNNTARDITKFAVDIEDPYFASLMAATIVPHVSGISRKHLTGSQGVITSTARYYLYYHMKRFLKDPRKMNSYITEDLKKLIKKNLPVKTTWKRKFERTRAQISYWYYHHPNRRNIRNYHYVNSNNTGVLGISYEEADRVIPRNEKTDWMTFIKEDSDGLTKTGQKLFQMALESYVYTVLGAQAQTRWSIVNQGAKSLQTQDIFHRLVKDTIAEDDPVKLISNMRTAIKNTNVVLNMAITPGIILIPSDLIILKKRIDGFNNTLTLATGEMKFGINKDVNKVIPPKPAKPTESAKPTVTKPAVVQQKTNTKIPNQRFSDDENETLYLLGSTVTIGFLVAKFLV